MSLETLYNPEDRGLYYFSIELENPRDGWSMTQYVEGYYLPYDDQKEPKGYRIVFWSSAFQKTLYITTDNGEAYQRVGNVWERTILQLVSVTEVKLQDDLSEQVWDIWLDTGLA